MAANSSNNSLIISSGTDRESDSGSSTTDYEPEFKKCKVENTPEEGNAKLHGANTLIEIPLRAATTLVEFSNQRNNVESASSNETPSGNASSTNRTEQEEDSSVLTIGNIVQQTLEASLRPDSPPRNLQTSREGEFIVLTLPDSVAATTTNSTSIIGNAPRVSTSAGYYGSVGAITAPAGDFPTIAREVVVRTGNGARAHMNSAGRSGGHSRRHRIRNRSHRGGNTRSQENNNDDSIRSRSSSSSFSSTSSSEYFTDDIDPMEIPSDEYVSPPPPRQRRNAIFMRRDPPPSALAQNEDDQYYHNELEVASVLDINENPIEDGSSTSGGDEEVLRSYSPSLLVGLEGLDETDDNFADNENVKSDVDSEPVDQVTNDTKGLNATQSDVSEKDKWLCSQCQAEKASPSYRYCLRCFKIRRTWLPPRPASRRLKTRKSLMRSNEPNSLNNSVTSRATVSSDTTDGEDVVDGHPAGSPSVVSNSPTPVNDAHHSGSPQVQQSLPHTQRIDMNEGFVIDENNPSTNRLSSDSHPGNVTVMEIFTPPLTSPEIRRRNEATNIADIASQSQSQSGSSSSQSQQSLFFTNSQNSCTTLASTQSSSPTLEPAQLSSPASNKTNGVVAALSTQCSICYVRDKDAAFVHNKIAHLYCCYTCADKILKKNGKCPICRERVLRVVKVIGV